MFYIHSHKLSSTFTPATHLDLHITDTFMFPSLFVDFSLSHSGCQHCLLYAYHVQWSAFYLCFSWRNIIFLLHRVLLSYACSSSQLLSISYCYVCPYPPSTHVFREIILTYKNNMNSWCCLNRFSIDAADTSRSVGIRDGFGESKRPWDPAC